MEKTHGNTSVSASDSFNNSRLSSENVNHAERGRHGQGIPALNM